MIYNNWKMISLFFVILSSISGWAYKEHLHVLLQDYKIQVISLSCISNLLSQELIILLMKKLKLKIKILRATEK